MPKPPPLPPGSEVLTPEKAAHVRKTMLASTYAFGKFVCNFPDLDPDVHGQMAAWVERPTRLKLGQAPRGFLKTTTWTIADKLRRVTADPNLRVLLSNETAENTQKWIGLMQAIVMSPIYGGLFPEVVPNPLKVKWNQQQLELRRTRHWPEATIEGIGVGGASTSRHFNIIVNDDLVGKEARESPSVMQKAIDHRKLCWSLMVNAAQSEIHDFGTKWHPNDVIDWILKNVSGVDHNVIPIWDADKLPRWPTRYPAEVIAQIRKEQGAEMFCTPAETPILMADWTYKPIGKIVPGDRIVGWAHLGSDRDSRLTVSIVKTVHVYNAPVDDLIMKSGRTVRCTAEHRWYRGRRTRRKEKATERYCYRPARVGAKLMLVLDPRNLDCSPAQALEAAWLAGFFDGEGTCTNQGLLGFSQGDKQNLSICQRLEEVLKFLGFDAAHWRHTKHAVRFYWLNGGLPTLQRFLHVVKPTKWKARIADQMWARSAHFIREEDEVLEIKHGAAENVYGLETTTGNYVAWGYASSNSLQYLNIAVGEGASEFDTNLLRYWHEEIDLEGSRILVLERPESEGGNKRVKFDDTNRFQVIDAGLSPESRNARTANIAAALTPPTPTEPFDIVFLEAKATKSRPDQVVEEAYATYKNTDPLWAAIEVFGGHQAFFYWISTVYPDMRIRKLPTDTHKSKDSRIREFWPVYLGQRRIYVHRSHTDMVDELAPYPNGVTVDLADAGAYLPKIWVPPNPVKPTRKLPKGVTPFDISDYDEDELIQVATEGRSPWTGY